MANGNFVIFRDSLSVIYTRPICCSESKSNPQKFGQTQPRETLQSLDNNEQENGTSDTGEYPHLNGAAAAVA
jgi:hypothetical protein